MASSPEISLRIVVALTGTVYCSPTSIGRPSSSSIAALATSHDWRMASTSYVTTSQVSMSG